VLRTLPLDNQFVKCIAFSPTGRLMATGEGDLVSGDMGRILIWDTATGERQFALDGHTEPVFALAFSPDGARLFSASQDRTTKVWDLKTRQEALTLRGHGDTVRGLALSRDGHLLATGSSDGTIRLWDAALPERNEPGEVYALEGHAEPVFAVRFGPRGRRAYSLDLGATLRGWDVKHGSPQLQHRIVEERRAFSFAVSPDGRTVAIATTAGNLHLFDPALGRVVKVIEAYAPTPIKGLAFSPDGSLLASASWDRTVGLTNLATGKTDKLRGHLESVVDVAFSPDGKQLASASHDGTVRIWDAKSGKALETLGTEPTRFRSVAFSHSGHLLTTAEYNGTVRIWDTASWKCRPPLRGHTGGVTSVAFSPDDRFIASAGDDRTVKVWDVADGKVIRTFHGHSGRVNSVAFSPDGRYLLSGGQDKVVRIWTFQPTAGAGAEAR
jgi:WD40 repeat protein